MKARLIRSTLAPWAVAIGATLLGSCAEEAPPPQAVLRPVKHITVESGAASIRDRVFSGSARSAEEAALSFKVSGTVAQVAVAVGEGLSRGDLIAELDRDIFNVELEQALAEQARSNALRRSAEADYQRVRLLYANDNASRNELDTALASAESAQASYSAAVQSVRLARLNLSYARLTAAEDCSVAEIDVEVNENVSAGQIIAQVNCGNAWEVLLSVPESLIASFHDGMAGVVQFPSLPGQSFQGAVTEVGIGTGDRRTFQVTLALDTAPDDIRSNLAAEVTFRFGTQTATGNRLFLPPVAVVEDERGTFVFVLQSTDDPAAAVLERRTIEVGEISELGFEILSGLEIGERVVTAGQIHARDGMRVRNQ